MSNTLRIGVGWSTEFKRRGLFKLRRPPRLKFADKAPSMFIDNMVKGGGNRLLFLRINERLRVPDLDGTTDAIVRAVDFFYVSSHGKCSPATQYRLILHRGEWVVSGADLGNSGPMVATFDTCDLVDVTAPGWKAPWLSAGRSLRLLLGFASPATVAEDSTLRGAAFAHTILDGDPIGPAWLRAVHENGYGGTDLAVALGFGDNLADAMWALDEMTLADLPAYRSSEIPVITERVCHGLGSS